MDCGASQLTLPVRPPRAGDEQLRRFAEPEGARPGPCTVITAPEYAWRVIRDMVSDTSTLEVVKDLGTYRLDEIDLELNNRTVERYSVRADQLESLRGEVRTDVGLRREGWHVHTATRTVLRSTPTHFHVVADLDAWEGERRELCRSWERWILRELV